MIGRFGLVDSHRQAREQPPHPGIAFWCSHERVAAPGQQRLREGDVAPARQRRVHEDQAAGGASRSTDTNRPCSYGILRTPDADIFGAIAIEGQPGVVQSVLTDIKETTGWIPFPS